MTSPRIVIIGAGFGGLGTAIELVRHGFTDITILERADNVGGVWRDNTYPNAACDVPSSLYSWSFAPNPNWPRRYSGQADILDYIESVAQDQGVRDLVRFGVEVSDAQYDDTSATWTITSLSRSGGQGETFEADFLVTATGQLSRPVIPQIAGATTFAGPAFHSAEWDHGVDLTGKRVVVLGTGASAIQFVPGIQPIAGQVRVFQRSAPYVVPKADRAYTRSHHRAFARFPRTQAFGRRLTWALSEHLNKSLVGTNPMKSLLEKAWRVHLRHQIKDPALRAKLKPDYPIGCKRLLFSNDWYPALAAPNVEVVTHDAVEILPSGVRAADGTVHEADVIIYGTGFAATDFLAPIVVTGAQGLKLAEAWSDGARAYFGICVPGFPNLGIVYGPNTNLGGSSIINMMESQSQLIRQLVQTVAGGGSIQVRGSVEESFDAEVQQRISASVWGGCDSWYRDSAGRVTTNWPGTVVEYKERTAELDLHDFDVSIEAVS